MRILIFVLDDGARGGFDLSYFYSADGSELISAQILSLPRSWELTRPVGHAPNPGALLLSINDGPGDAPRCVLAFSVNEPFFAYVVGAREKVAIQMLRRNT